MDGGYIKLFRTLERSAVWDGNPGLLKVWIWCLMQASFAERVTMVGNTPITLAQGQFVTGRLKGAAACQLPVSTFRNYMNALTKLQNIGQNSDSRATIVTVLNWASYQLEDGERGQNQDSRRTAAGQPQDTIIRSKEVKKSVVPAAPRPKFEAPGKALVVAYAKEYRDTKGYNVNDQLLIEWCANFYDHFEERGWTSSNGKKVVDWTAGLRRWIRTDYQRLNRTRK